MYTIRPRRGDRAPSEWAAARWNPAPGLQSHGRSHTDWEDLGPETSKQQSGVPVAEPLHFLRRESVSSKPDFQNSVITFQGLQEGFCPTAGDAIVGQLQDFQT